MNHVRQQTGRTAGHLFILVLAVTILSIVGSAAAQQPQETKPAPKRNLTIDDLFQIKDVADPQVSPEGKWVAYTVRSVNPKEDKSETQIWMIPAAGGEPIPMTAKGSPASHPRWSPDGKYLGFLSARGESRTEVWLLNRNGGDSQQLTEVHQGVESYEWSPDGSRLVLLIQDPSPEDIATAVDHRPAANKKRL
jgi:Tol biopolymer transport system component